MAPAAAVSNRRFHLKYIYKLMQYQTYDTIVLPKIFVYPAENIRTNTQNVLRSTWPVIKCIYERHTDKTDTILQNTLHFPTYFICRIHIFDSR